MSAPAATTCSLHMGKHDGRGPAPVARRRLQLHLSPQDGRALSTCSSWALTLYVIQAAALGGTHQL